MSGFLPKDYKRPQTGGGYMKLEDGDNVFRILSDAITGFEYWNVDNKPVRSKEFPKNTPSIKTDKDGNPQKVKHFWAFIVWNYATNSVEILQITQSSIQDELINLNLDPDWGDPKEYDIKINRKGQDLETKYSVSPKPRKPISEEISQAFKEKKINLQALYVGANPFDVETVIAYPDDDLTAENVGF